MKSKPFIMIVEKVNYLGHHYFIIVEDAGRGAGLWFNWDGVYTTWDAALEAIRLELKDPTYTL